MHIITWWSLYTSYPTLGNIVVYVSKPINNNNQILWRLWNIISFDMPSVFYIESKTSYMEDV